MKLRLDMKNNRKCITISLPASIWNHCFVGIEVREVSIEDKTMSKVRKIMFLYVCMYACVCVYVYVYVYTNL